MPRKTKNKKNAKTYPKEKRINKRSNLKSSSSLIKSKSKKII